MNLGNNHENKTMPQQRCGQRSQHRRYDLKLWIASLRGSATYPPA
jgi:hypothetical protein